MPAAPPRPAPERIAAAVTDSAAPSTYQEELRTFLFLAVVMAPVIAVATVAGWGFTVWMFQLLTGRLPGPA